MKQFLIKKGTACNVLSGDDRNHWSDSKVELKIMTKDKIYEVEDMTIDQITPRCMPSHPLAKRYKDTGFYAFNLPDNTLGYHTIIVHKTDLKYRQ